MCSRVGMLLDGEQDARAGNDHVLLGLRADEIGLRRYLDAKVLRLLQKSSLGC